MTTTTPLHCGNELLTADKEKLKTSGNFANTADAWCASAGGGYDFMKTLNKISILLGWDHLTTKTSGYLAATCVPRVYTTAKKLHESYHVYQKDGVHNVQRCFDWSFQGLDFAAMCAFATTFFTKEFARAKQAGNWLLFGRDIADVGMNSTQIIKAHQRAKELKLRAKEYAGSEQPVLHANSNLIKNSFLKLIKAVLAAVTGFFTCYALAFGIPLISATVAASVALTSVLFNILAYYHKNYWCDSFLKVEYNPRQSITQLKLQTRTA